MFKKLLLGLIVSFMLFSVHARTPENLASTDIFTDIVPTAENGLSKAIPLSNLNLCYGAELFMSRAVQALYANGDVIRVEKTIKTLDPLPFSPTEDVYTTHFYKDLVSKTPLTFVETNPLAILARALFFQVPETSSLGDFKVSELAKIVDKKSELKVKPYLPDLMADQWALFVAYVAKKAYEQQAGPSTSKQVKAQRVVVDKLNQTRLASSIIEFAKRSNIGDVNFVDLINACIKYSEENGFGAWFPVRILMAGIYDLFGHDQKLIFEFYAKLQKALQATFADLEVVTATIVRIVIPASEALPAPFTQGTSVPGKAYEAYKLIKSLSIFEPLSNRRVTLRTGEQFSDCFETTVRNIVLKLILQPDRKLNTAALAEPYKAFFDNNDLVAQQKQGAYDAWAQLLVDEFRGKEWLFLKTSYELKPSLSNLLVSLNRIFGLNIEVLSTYQPQYRQEASETVEPETGETLEPMLTALNAALAGKLGVLQPYKEKDDEGLEHEVGIISVQDFDDVVEEHRNKIRGTLHSPTGSLAFAIKVGEHGELSEQDGNKDREITSQQSQDFPYLVARLKPTAEDLNSSQMIGLLNQRITEDGLELFLGNDEEEKNPLPAKDCSPCVQRMLFAAVLQNHETNFADYLEGITKLAAQGEEIETAKVAVHEAMNSSDEDKDWYTFKLFEVLVPSGYMVEEAQQAAEIMVKSNIEQSRSQGLQIFKILVENGHAIEEAVRVAHSISGEALEGSITSLMYPIGELFAALLEEEKGIAEASQAAYNMVLAGNTMWKSEAHESGQASPALTVQVPGEQLFQKLHGLGHGEAEARKLLEIPEGERNFMVSGILELYNIQSH